jgi:hypothetical protein
MWWRSNCSLVGVELHPFNLDAASLRPSVLEAATLKPLNPSSR